MAAAAAAASSSSRPDWVILEPYIFLRDDASFPGNDPTAASNTNSRGDDVRVCFRLCAPPEPSQIYINWPAGTGPCDWILVVGAHSDAVLFQMGYPVLPGCNMFDYFLYRSSGGGSQPSLDLLPSLQGTIAELKARWESKEIDLLGQHLRRLSCQDIGILRRGVEELAVAELQILRSQQGPELHSALPGAADGRSKGRRSSLQTAAISTKSPSCGTGTLTWSSPLEATSAGLITAVASYSATCLMTP
ncbi:hypothetical protein ABZP36_033376 [Zizania latifolia]